MQKNEQFSLEIWKKCVFLQQLSNQIFNIK